MCKCGLTGRKNEIPLEVDHLAHEAADHGFVLRHEGIELHRFDQKFLVIAIAAAGEQELALADAVNLGGDCIGKTNGRADDLTILDAAIHLQMVFVSNALNRALVAEVEVDIKALAGVEGAENLRNRFMAVAKVPGLGGAEILAGLAQCGLEQRLAVIMSFTMKRINLARDRRDAPAPSEVVHAIIESRQELDRVTRVVANIDTIARPHRLAEGTIEDLRREFMDFFLRVGLFTDL